MRRTASLALFALLILGSAAAKEIDSRGSYRGFFQSTMHPSQWGLIHFVIGDVRNHRFSGVVTMLIGGVVPVPFPVDGTVSTSGEFTGNGRSPAGKVQFHGQIMFIDGGAAVADATYFVMPNGGGSCNGCELPGGVAPPEPDRGTATLIRNFVVGPDMPPPNANGMWDGLATSAVDGSQTTFHLDVMQDCSTIGDKRMPGTSFVGSEVIDPGMKFYFQGSINGDGRFLVIGWSFTNDRFIVSGNYRPPDPGKMAMATADYMLFFGNGSTDHGMFVMDQQLFPPDPCQISGR